MNRLVRGLPVFRIAALILSPSFLADAQLGKPNAWDNVDHYVWDLSSLYPDRAAWEAERATIESKFKVIGELRGTLGRNAKSLADALDQVSDLRGRAAKMAVYGVLVTSADTRSETAQMQYDVGTALESRVESAIAFIRDEISNLGAKRLNEWFHQEPRLERHRIRINRILREAPHSLPEPQQSIVASMARWPQLSGDAYWALHESDVGWPTFQNSEGKQSTFNVYAYRSAGEKSARAKFLERLHGLENAFGLLLARRIDADLTIARHRKFQDGAEAYWFLRDGMPPGTHRVMIDVARKNLATAHRYFELRARALNRERVSYADFYDPIPGVSRSFSISDTMNIAVAASAPLGPEYQQRLRQRFQARWMHLPSWPNKRVSGEVYPPVGGANPYFIMGYLPTLPKSRAFAGCVTLMMSDAENPTRSRPRYPRRSSHLPELRYLHRGISFRRLSRRSRPKSPGANCLFGKFARSNVEPVLSLGLGLRTRCSSATVNQRWTNSKWDRDI
jgi:oligoendopeptidase F